MPVHINMQKGLEGRMLLEMVEDDSTSYSRWCEKVSLDNAFN